MALLNRIGDVLGRVYGSLTAPGPRRPAATAAPQSPANDLSEWALRTVEKVRTASVGGRFRLAPWLDNHTAETPEIRRRYREMLREPTLKAALGTKVLAVAALDAQVHAAEPDDPRSRDVADFCRHCLTRVGGRQVGAQTNGMAGTRKIAWNVLGPGLIDGWSLCEMKWSPIPIASGKWRGKRVLADWKGKDTRHLYPMLDPFKNVVGYRGGSYNGGHVFEGEELKDLVAWVNWPLFESPTGMSDFRAPFRAYWIKDTVMQLWGLHLDRYSGPYLKGTYPYAHPEVKAALEQALEQARGGSWLTVPEGALVEAITLATGAPADYRAAVEHCDREMLIGTLGAYLQVLEGQVSNGRGDTSIHKETAELFQWYLAAALGDLVTHQVVPELVAENYTDAEPPTVTWGAVSTQELLNQLKLDEGLQKLGLKLSKRSTYERYSLQEPSDPEDTLGGDGGGGGPGGPPGGPPALPFAEPRRHCQEGPNAGKPGPCPEAAGKAGPVSHPALATAAAGAREAVHNELPALVADKRGKERGAALREHKQATLRKLRDAAEPHARAAATAVAEKVERTLGLPPGSADALRDPALARAAAGTTARGQMTNLEPAYARAGRWGDVTPDDLAEVTIPPRAHFDPHEATDAYDGAVEDLAESYREREYARLGVDPDRDYDAWERASEEVEPRVSQLQEWVRQELRRAFSPGHPEALAESGGGPLPGPAVHADTPVLTPPDPTRLWRCCARAESRLGPDVPRGSPERRELEGLRLQAEGGYRHSLGRDLDDGERRTAAGLYARACASLAQRLTSMGRARQAARARRLARLAQEAAGEGGGVQRFAESAKPALNVHVAPPAITIHVPQQGPPVVKVENQVNVPKQQPPVVNVENQVNVPKQPAPEVTVNVPEQPAPEVTVNVPEQAPPTVDVWVPSPRLTEKEISYNAEGLPVRIEEREKS